MSACETGQSKMNETGVIDNRPPPLRDGGHSGGWSTDDPGRPTGAWFVEDTLKYRLPVLLEPSSPPGGEVGKVSLSVRNVGFDRFVLVSASSDETSSWLRVTSSNLIDEVDCGPASVPITIRGTQGCFGTEGPTSLILSWREEWVHQARWTQDADSPPDQHLAYFRDWLDDWTAHRPRAL